ncbi:MAG: 4-(cytidine 5'-diphospho)-2-C-methyl-D-erythritol kinase [Bryobacteraceae bacterium]|nr:4-(cytidine 5'-diphospho)-2-C-methyl-D-erythritol kinase [Bryobacteraceae bacterium]
MRVEVKAFAKINLGLKVLYRRPDGYHELRTVFQTISLADDITLEFTRGRPTAISLEDPLGIPDNLMTRAARMVLDEARVTGAVHMALRKRIPMGGGLGGGSTDAAAVLLALPALVGKRISPVRLAEMAVTLGADVPFFLLGGTALGLGRGEELYTLPDVPQAKGVLVCPRVHVSTAEAFRTLARGGYAELTSPLGSRILEGFQFLARSVTARRPAGEWASHCENDFEPAVFRQHPNLKKIKRKLVRLGALPAVMTGSGAALFGLFDTLRAAEEARQSFPDEVTHRFRLVGRRQYAEYWRKWLAAARPGATKE